jgi:sulfite reductase (NADPH) hemoprotein beta-component
MAEIGFVGKAPGKYQLWLGGNANGMRLNQVFKETIKEVDLETELRPLLTRWKAERSTSERFGDFATRVLLPEAVALRAAAAAAAPQPAPVAQPVPATH